MSVLKVKNGNQWDIVPAIKGDTGDPAADESITDDMLVTDGIKTEIEWLWGNQLTDSREGELLHAEDAYTAPAVDISVDGKSTQVTTTGKNLFDKDGPKGYWSDEDGSFIASTLRVWWSIPVSEGDVIRTSSVGVWNSQTYLNGVFVAGGINAKYSDGYVIPAGVDEIRGSIANNGWETGIVTINNSDLTYEIYTGGKPAPSPDYPQEIVSVENPELVFHGENMWGGAKMAADFNTLKAVAYGSNEHGDYIEFEQGGGLPNGATFYPCHFKDNTQYTIVLAFENTRGSSQYATIVVVYTDGTIKEISGPNTDGSYAQFAFVTAENKTVDHFRGVLRTVNNRYYYNQCGIFEGVRTVNDFQPYTSATASLLPDGYSLRSLPDGTKDELHLSYLRPSKRAGWAWYSRELVKRVGKLVVDGSETWYKGNTSADGATATVRYHVFDEFDPFKYSDTRELLSDKFTYERAVIWNEPDAYVWKFRQYSKQLLFSISNDALGVTSESTTTERTEAYKTWLASNNVTVLYILATPITETLDPIELPIMPSRTVNVWSDPATNLNMTYIQDSNLIIENLEATIADIATS